MIQFKKSQRIHLFRALGHSLTGLHSLWIHEKAFRLEVYLTIPLMLCLYLFHTSITMTLTLILLWCLLLLVEALNSGLETIVDRISLEIHPLSKRIKDIGSAAVFIAVMMNFIGWLAAILIYYHKLS